MSIDNIAQYFDFTNVSNLINIVIVSVSVLLNFKMKTDNIIKTAKLKEAKGEITQQEMVTSVIAQAILAQNQALKEIVMASKLPGDAKLRIVDQFTSLTNTVSNLKLDKVYEAAEQVVTNVKEVGNTGLETFNVVKDILGNAKSEQ